MCRCVAKLTDRKLKVSFQTRIKEVSVVQINEDKISTVNLDGNTVDSVTDFHKDSRYRIIVNSYKDYHNVSSLSDKCTKRQTLVNIEN